MNESKFFFSEETILIIDILHADARTQLKIITIFEILR